MDNQIWTGVVTAIQIQLFGFSIKMGISLINIEKQIIFIYGAQMQPTKKRSCETKKNWVHVPVRVIQSSVAHKPFIIIPITGCRGQTAT